MDIEQLVERIVYNVNHYDETPRVTIEEKDPILFIAWDLGPNGLLPRLAACPAHPAPDPAFTTQGTSTYNRMTMEFTSAGLNRPALSKTVLELVLLTSVTGGINGPQVGKLLTDNTNTLLTVISYNTVPELQNALNRLFQLCPVLRWDQSGLYTAHAAECFRAYAYKTSLKPIKYNVGTEKRNEFD